MDFRDLTYITKVADCGSITEAARQLFISQPSLSYIISKVEQDIGVQLFDRRSYPLSLTYAGEKYVETARQILRLNDNLRRELVDIGLGEKGKIKFGIPTERAGYMLPKVLLAYKRQFPKVDVRIYEAMSDDLLASLQRDEINFYIIPRDIRDLPQGLQTELIYKERLHLVTAPDAVKESDYADREKRQVTTSFLKRHPFIVLKRGHSIRKKTDAVFRKLKITPEISMEVSSCNSSVQLADAGLGITIVPQRALESLGGVERFSCYRYFESYDMWDVNVVYKAYSYLDRTERAFIDLMKTTFSQSP